MRAASRPEPVRLIFAGTPDFAEVALQALLAAGHRPVQVLTQPDRPAGRGQQAQASPVKRTALAAGIEVFQPRSLRDPEAQARIAAVEADLMIVAAYGLILPPAVLAMPRAGCLNIHASLLPRWRGAAPIQRAIDAGDAETGITIMQMDAGLDTGPMLRRAALAIGADESAGSLHDRLAHLGGQEIVAALDDLAQGRLQPTDQPDTGVTYAAKIDKAEAPLDWCWPAPRLADRIRAFDPFPGATAQWIDGRQAAAPPLTLKIWQVEPMNSAEALAAMPGDVLHAPGRVVAIGRDDLRVVCGAGTVLRILSLQRPGGRRISAAQFLQGLQLAPETVSEYCQFKDLRPASAD